MESERNITEIDGQCHSTVVLGLDIEEKRLVTEHGVDEQFLPANDIFSIGGEGDRGGGGGATSMDTVSKISLQVRAAKSRTWKEVAEFPGGYTNSLQRQHKGKFLG